MKGTAIHQGMGLIELIFMLPTVVLSNETQ